MWMCVQHIQLMVRGHGPQHYPDFLLTGHVHLSRFGVGHIHAPNFIVPTVSRSRSRFRHTNWPLCLVIRVRALFTQWSAEHKDLSAQALPKPVSSRKIRMNQVKHKEMAELMAERVGARETRTRTRSKRSKKTGTLGGRVGEERMGEV